MVVNIPGVGQVNFPDSMSPEEIAVAAGKVHARSVPSWMNGPTQEKADLAKPGFLDHTVFDSPAKAMGKHAVRAAVTPGPLGITPVGAAATAALFGAPWVSYPAQAYFGVNAAKDLYQGGTERLAKHPIQSVLDASMIALPAAEGISGMARAARAARAAKEAAALKPAVGSGTGWANTVGKLAKAEWPTSTTRMPTGPYQQTLQVAENAPVSNIAQAAKAVERRAPTRVSDSATDALYQRMRAKIATGEATGTPELRALGDQKSALDASREAAEKAFTSGSRPGEVSNETKAAKDAFETKVGRKTPKNLIKGEAARDSADTKRTLFGGVREQGKLVRPEARSPIKSAKPGVSQDFADLFKRFGGDEGRVDLKMLGASPNVLKGLGQLRSSSMLSGLALPMSMAGDLGSVFTAAAEHGTMKPIKELMNVPENLKALKTAWKSGANPAEVAHGSGLNIPGRLIGMFDDATQALHSRAGIPKADSQRLLLQNPDYLLKGMRKMVPGSELPFPFLKTNSNYFTEGLKHALDLGNLSDSGMSLGKKALTAGSIGAGYETGKHTDSPVAIKLGGAAMGVRGIPFMIGAGVGAGRKSMEKGNKFGTGVRKAMGGFSPLQDMGITNLIADPKSGLAKMLGIEPAGLRLVKRKKSTY